MAGYTRHVSGPSAIRLSVSLWPDFRKQVSIYNDTIKAEVIGPDTEWLIPMVFIVTGCKGCGALVPRIKSSP